MEHILCAAIWYNDGMDTYVHQPINIKTGFVVCGRRHHNCFATKAMLQGLRVNEYKQEPVQGFLTNTDRFVDRIEGLSIAKEAGQYKPSGHHDTGRLFSEDLY